MKGISKKTAELIQELSYEEGLGLPLSAVEKDLHVTEALAAISTVENDHFMLVFSGGTCLSKGHGIIERFSEDIDIKVVLREGYKPSSKNELKKRLSELKKTVIDKLVSAGFPNEDLNIKSDNGNNYTQINAYYEEMFPLTSQLRGSRVQIELVVSDVQLPPLSLHLDTLFSKLSNTAHFPFRMNCIAVMETAAEKLVSFPRRL